MEFTIAVAHELGLLHRILTLSVSLLRIEALSHCCMLT